VHVGFALLTLFPGQVGGSEANVRGLLGQFTAGNGPERVTVLANALVTEAYAASIGNGVALDRVRSYRAGRTNATRLAAMMSARLAPRIAAREVPDGLDVLHHPLTVPIPVLPGVPTVTTVYDLQHHELPQLFSRAERAYRRWAYDGAVRKADLTLTTSEYSRERLAELPGADADRIESIPMGIDHERFHPGHGDADERIAPRLPERYVLYPANLWPHKNHARLIEALGRIEDSDLELVLTGQDYGRGEALREAAQRAQVEHRVHHLGHVAADELPALMRAAEAMIFPSLYEGFGSPPLEAMACGCPVAASRRASLQEMVGDAALEIEPESVDSIAEAITAITTSTGACERRRDLRDRGLRHASGFTWHACAQRHLAAYERAAATSPASARS
jgi:glycosyltransferase involved in cell wall biosynthesis